MKRLIVVLLLGAAFWHFYLNQAHSPMISNLAADGSVMGSPVVIQPNSSSFSLDSLRASSSTGRLPRWPAVNTAAMAAGTARR